MQAEGVPREDGEMEHFLDNKHVFDMLTLILRKNGLPQERSKEGGRKVETVWR
jgi:hypothetical protein